MFVPCSIEDGFKLSAQALKKAITPKTRLLMLNSPSNPTGAVYSRADLEALGEILRAHPDIIIVTDDIYEHINLDGAPIENIINVCPDLKGQTVIINGVSKAYAMTGWRIGWAAGPEKIITAMTNLQSQSTSNPCSIAQAAAEEALTGDQSVIAPMVTAYRERMQITVAALNNIPGVNCLVPEGAFYAFPDVSEVCKKFYNQGKIDSATDQALCEYLLDKAGVALVPGSAFGADGFVRLSFATSIENLKIALGRITLALT
jgi:aspartate aminotransferase